VNATSQFSVRKILVVDDNPVVLRALSLALGARGYEVFTALDASEAFGTARLEKLDLILLDIFFPPDVMQSGMTWDAFRIIEWMQRVGAAEGVPIVVISGADAEKFEDRCLAAGAKAFIQKPICMPELLGTIRDILYPGVPAEESELAMVLPPRIIPSALPSSKYL
jgi:two-component system, OmpR family, KDP operon response regulator KdpE